MRTVPGPRPEPRAKANRLSRLGLLITGSLLCPGCDQPEPAATPNELAPATVDVSSLPAEEIPERVLRECHGAIEGMDRVAARIWLPDQTMLKLFTRLPHELRIEYPDGEVQIVDHERAARMDRDADQGATMQPLADEAAQRARAVRALIDIATLGPIRRATACERLGPNTFRLSQPEGEPWQLVLQPDSLLVESLSGDGCQATVDEHLLTKVSRIVRQLTMDPLGSCTVRLDSVDFQFEDALFRPDRQQTVQIKANGDSAAPPAFPLLQMNRERRPTTPEATPTKELWWLVVQDPGDWEQRAQVVQQQLALLSEHGQKQAGFVGLLREDGTARLAIGFRQQDKNAPAFEPPAGWDVRHVPAQQALVVFPPTGSAEDRIDAGTRQLQDRLAEQGLRATSPILAQPYFHLNEGPPPADRLANPVVRVSVHIGN